MIRVLHIITDSNIGGAGVWVLNSVGAMSDDFEVFVALPRDSQLISRFVGIVDESHLIEVEAIGDRSFSLAGYTALRKVIKKCQPDIVHTHASLSGRLAAKTIGGIAIVNSRHCVEAVPSGLSAVIKGWVNNRLSHKIIAVSEAIEQNLLDSGLNANKVTLLSNGVKPIRRMDKEARMKSRASFALDENKLTIGYIGRLEEVKGPLFIPEIAEQLRLLTDVPFTIVVAGSGSLKDALQASIIDKSLEDTVQCIGQINDVTAFYNSVDIVINTSRSEGIPLSLIEGMSIGLPIVAFNVGSLSQLVDVGCNGYLVEAFDTKTYAQQLKELLEKAALREAYGNRSKEIMNERFHVNLMNRQLEEIYREVKR